MCSKALILRCSFLLNSSFLTSLFVIYNNKYFHYLAYYIENHHNFKPNFNLNLYFIYNNTVSGCCELIGQQLAVLPNAHYV